MNTLKKGIHLTPRLSSVMRMTGDSRHIVDVGCDHGRLSAALLHADEERRVTATDISPSSVKKAERLRDKCGFSGRMDVYLADGFLPEYKEAPDCAVIAGMGGMLIADIISRGMNISRTLNRIVMQPMRGVEELRRFLYEENFHALDEELIYDSGRFYQVLAFRYMGTRERFPEGYPADYFEFGHMLFIKHDPLLRSVLENRRNELDSALSSALSSGRRQDIDDGIEILRTKLLKTEQAIEYLHTVSN